ncbi:MAG TPA: hypothetical protein VND23_00910 [Acidimicrobiales bacterium]|nr:hypothetical protein [Acidimicrobiales bacterium]
MTGQTRHPGPLAAAARHRPRAALVLAATAALLTACGGSPAATSASTTVPRVTTPAAPVARLPLATLRSRYLAIVTPADKAFAAFQPKLDTLTVAVSRAQLNTALAPVARAIARSGRSLYELRRAAPPRIARDMLVVVSSDNTVWQGLQDLDQGWGSRSFDYASWQGAFAAAVHGADAAGATLRSALGARRT